MICVKQYFILSNSPVTKMSLTHAAIAQKVLYWKIDVILLIG